MGHTRVHFRVPFVENEGKGVILECRITVCDNSGEPIIPHTQTINLISSVKSIATHFEP